MNIISTTYHKYSDEHYLKLLKKYNSREFFLQYKKHLSLYFVFLNLYNNSDEPINNRLYYNEICAFYKNKYSIAEMTSIFDTAFFDKGNANTANTAKNIKQLFCDKNCNTCPQKDTCF